MSGRVTRPFSYKPLGVFCAIGGRNAVAEILGQRISGFFAWFMWRSVYLLRLPSWSRRVKVGADWAWDLLFSRDLVNLKTDPTERVSRAYYRPGDFVFRQGEPALNFYSVEVTTLGAQVFSRISKALAPLQQRLAEAIRQRTTSPWTRMPHVHAMLSAVRPISERSSVSIRSLMSPDPLVMTMEDTAAAAALSMWSRGLKSLPVVTSESGRLIGCIRAETVMQAVLRRVARPEGFPEATAPTGVYVEGGITVSG